MSDIGQQSTTSTTFSVPNVSVIHVVPQLSIVLGEATDKDSTASAFSFTRRRGTSRRVIKTDVKLLFLSLCLGVLLTPGCGASQPVSNLGVWTPKAHRYPDAHEVRGVLTKSEYDAVLLSRCELLV